MPKPPRMRAAALTATALLLSSLLAGCSGDDSGNDEDLTAQELDWKACPAPDQAQGGGGSPSPLPADGTWECATMKAPRDWDDPEGDTIGLDLIRVKSSGAENRRIGSLIFNFGGPGGSGVTTLPTFGDLYEKLRTRYDLVSFDPRGVGRSAPVLCEDDQQLDAYFQQDTTPDDTAEKTELVDSTKRFNAACEKNSGEMLPHVATTEAARDMDLMRQVLGDDKLHYFGISYGTELGGVYAHLFPGTVGRMILDAVVDPSADSEGHTENQARGFQRALNNYLKSTGQGAEAGTQKIVDLLKRIDANPMPTSSDRKLTESLALTGIIRPLYSEASWPTLTSALAAAERGDGSELLALGDDYNDRDASGRYGTGTHSQRVISCLDDKQRPTVEETKKLLPRFEKVSPVFGPMLGWDTGGWCHDWPVAGQYDTPEVSAPGAAPILLVGNTGDPATPYEGARRMADELGKGVGVMLTWKGEGHSAYGKGSGCVDSTVNAYLLQGTVPKDGKVCS
ncbi:alpha/beta hydrolase [Streptomyces sp. NPDC008079]|uniref:alpha/beta hydrolase n=1 Tax=Streptomyces sp. NPDC008079 TaxID=3364806 RepID=UPI0036E74497